MTLKQCIRKISWWLLLVAVSVYFLICKEGDLRDQLEWVGIGTLSLLLALWVLYDYRRENARHLRAEQRVEAAEQAAELPFTMLSARFLDIAPRDEMVDATRPESFLGWKTHGDGDFWLYRDGTDGGEGWVAFWWGCRIKFGQDASGHTYLRSVRGWDHIRDAEVEELFRRHALPMTDSFRGINSTGLAFYREGKLTLYPAAYAEDFRDSFMKTIFAPDNDFREWAEMYYAEDEA